MTFGDWSLEDEYVFSSEFSPKSKASAIFVWNSQSRKIVHKLEKHTNRIIALHESPILANVMLSAGYDGQIIIWDLLAGTCLKSFQVGNCNIYTNEVVPLECLDCRFSDDGMHIAATDVWGQLWLFTVEGSAYMKRSPPDQQFFQADSDAIVRSMRFCICFQRLFIFQCRHRDGRVLDSSRQIAPHLIHPQILLDFECMTHTAEFQSNLTTEQRLKQVRSSIEIDRRLSQQRYLTKSEVQLQDSAITLSSAEIAHFSPQKARRKLKSTVPRRKRPTEVVITPAELPEYIDDSEEDPLFEPTATSEIEEENEDAESESTVGSEAN